MQVLLSAAELAAGIDRLADTVRRAYGRRPIVVVGVLTGLTSLVVVLAPVVLVSMVRRV